MPVDGDAVIFISYRRADSKLSTRQLHDALAGSFGAGLVFLDVEDIPAGAVFAAHLDEAIARAAAVIAVIGPGWSSASNDGGRRLDDPNDHVRRELERALELDKLVVPVLVDGAQMPSAAELPGGLTGLAGRQAVELNSEEPREGLARLVRALGAASVVPPPPDPFQEDARRRIERRDAWHLLGEVGASREAVERYAQSRPSSSWHWEEEVLVFRGGKKFQTRLLGVLLVSDEKLPMQARVRVRDRGATTSVEVHVWEDWGRGFTWGLEQRYSSLFTTWFTDLRRATGAPPA
jgi:hypothetical protein